MIHALKYILPIALMTASSTISMSQSVKKLTLEELSYGGSNYKFTENIYGLQWWGDTCVRPDEDQLTAIDPKTGRESLLVEREAIKSIIEEAEGKSINLPTLQSITTKWAEPQLLIRNSGKLFVIDWNTKQVVAKQALPANAANTDFDYTKYNVAYTVDNNLFVNGKAVTSEPDGIVCGQSVHRNEFGISKGTFWSPDGSKLAFYRMDESMVSEYPLVDITARVGKLTPVRYPMAGMTSHKVYVGIYDVASGKTTYLDAGDPTDRYFTNISWSPDSKSVFLIELNRDQNHSKLCQYDSESGKLTAVLYEEENAKYVEPESPIIFLPWDSNKFIYQSQRSGFNHLYLMDLGKKITTNTGKTKIGSLYKENLETRQLTDGDWMVKSFVGFNSARKEVVYTSTENSSQQVNIFKLNIEKGVKTQLDNATGVHSAQLSKSGSYLIDSYSSPETPRTVDICSAQKPEKRINLLDAKDPLAGYELPQIETGTIKAADGVTDLHYRIVKPADFNPGKKYPAIVYVYGGPHAHMIQDSWRYSARGWDLYMASLGYVMFTVDNRGSENRGFEFESATFRKLGVEECKDQIKGVDFLKSLPYIDSKRIGVHGWSFGGHMTTALMLRHPDTFKVGVAGGPVIDWSYYEVMYGERYMDTPQSNPEGYKETNLKNLAGNLKGKLLMIHDYQDETCVPQHTLSFIKACVDALTYPDLFIYPGHKHNVAGKDRVHLEQKISQYFIDNL